MKFVRMIASGALALLLPACNSHAVDLTNPSPADVEAALAKFREIGPATKTGRWEVAVSRPGVALEGVDKATADNIRALGKAMNTTTRCRKEPYPLDMLTEIAIKVNIRKGCLIERLTVDPDRLAYSAQCTVADTELRDETTIQVWPDRFVTTRKTSNGRETGVKQYDGQYVSPCQGNEQRQQALWSDPR